MKMETFSFVKFIIEKNPLSYIGEFTIQRNERINQTIAKHSHVLKTEFETKKKEGEIIIVALKK
ncbi:MAG: hypothetical protein HGA33_01380 [Candidatus Moranbacteria bacterium]|nr:hypothetical protein [Candidatus Moranbacteria bacterium]